jgi:hypothetical protein
MKGIHEKKQGNLQGGGRRIPAALCINGPTNLMQRPFALRVTPVP